MKVGIIVLCRYNSSRLHGKILKEIAGKPILTYILERVAGSKKADQIVVATSDQPSDDPIESYCLDNNLHCFRGSLENVSDRFLQCALAYDLDYAIRINGDNLFTDPALIDQAIELSLSGDHDFVSNVDQRTYPTGMSVEVVKVEFYQEMVKEFDKEEYKEHVTLYFYQNPMSGSIRFFYNQELETAHGLKLAVDCEEDLNFVSLLIQKMDKPHTEYSWQEIVKLATHEQ